MKIHNLNLLTKTRKTHLILKRRETSEAFRTYLRNYENIISSLPTEKSNLPEKKRYQSSKTKLKTGQLKSARVKLVLFKAIPIIFIDVISSFSIHGHNES